MIKKIISILITLTLIFGIVGCGKEEKGKKDDLTTEQKKEIVEDLQKEIEDETVVKLNIKNIKVEDWNKFKEEFNSWKTYEERAWKEYIANGNETDLTIEEINATMEQYKTNLNNYSPKELKDVIEEMFSRNEKLMAIPKMNGANIEGFDYEGFNNALGLVQEKSDLIDNTIEKYDGEIS